MKPEYRERRRQIVEAFKASDDATLASVAEQFGITRERVRQIVSEHERETGESLGRRKPYGKPLPMCETCGKKRTRSKDAKDCRNCYGYFLRYGKVRNEVEYEKQRQRRAYKKAATLHAYLNEEDLDAVVERLGLGNRMGLISRIAYYRRRDGRPYARPAHLDGRKNTPGVRHKDDILRDYASGMPARDVAEKYGVSRGTVYKIASDNGVRHGQNRPREDA
jgi:hypothetical protein